jgi:protein O-mannosyl-transferase
MLASAAVFAITLVVFAPVRHNDFLQYDDNLYVTENPHLKKHVLDLEGLRWPFVETYETNWIPVTYLSLEVDRALFGFDPAGYHAVNVALHAASAALLLWALAGATRSLGASSFVAGVFALHPLHVESVAWVAERKDVLSACFGLGALWSYSVFAQQGRRAAYWGAVALFAAALLSKPMLVTLPFLLLLLDAWPLCRLGSLRELVPRLSEKAPFWLLAAGSCVVTLFAQVTNMSPLSLRLRLDNSIVAYAEYLRRAIAPVDLAAMYPYRLLEPRVVIACAALLIAITGLAVAQRRRRPWLLVGWLWFTGMLVPTLGLVQVGVQAFADRYTYLPFLGLALCAAWAGEELAERLPRGREVMAGVAALVLAGCAVQTRRQVETWHDTLSLFTHAVEVTRSNWYAHTEIGAALARQGDFVGAYDSFEAALRIRPRYARALINMGQAQLALGNSAEGLRSIERGLAEEPNIRGGRLAYAISLEHAQRFADAEAAYAAAASDPQGSRDARLRLARLLSVAPDGLRDGAKALALCEQVCAEAPCDSPEELDIWGMAAMEAGRPELAVERAGRAAGLARARGDLPLAAKIEARAGGYQRGQPVRLRSR